MPENLPARTGQPCFSCLWISILMQRDGRKTFLVVSSWRVSWARFFFLFWGWQSDPLLAGRDWLFLNSDGATTTTNGKLRHHSTHEHESFVKGHQKHEVVEWRGEKPHGARDNRNGRNDERRWSPDPARFRSPSCSPDSASLTATVNSANGGPKLCTPDHRSLTGPRLF